MTDPVSEVAAAPVPVAVPIERRTSTVVARNPRCRPLFDLYEWAKADGARSWNQVEERFLEAMFAFDESVAATAGRTDMTDAEKSQLSADLQNGKGDSFNDLLALLLERTARASTRSTSATLCPA